MNSRYSQLLLFGGKGSDRNILVTINRNCSVKSKGKINLAEGYWLSSQNSRGIAAWLGFAISDSRTTPGIEAAGGEDFFPRSHCWESQHQRSAQGRITESRRGLPKPACPGDQRLYPSEALGVSNCHREKHVLSATSVVMFLSGLHLCS